MSETKAVNYFKARESYNKARRLLLDKLKTEGSAKILLQLGQLQMLMDEHAEAEKSFLNAISKEPNMIKAHESLGVIYLQREDFKNAVKYLETAVVLDADDMELKYRLGLAYLRAKMLDKAEVVYNRILAVIPNHIDSQIGLSEVYISQADIGDADMYNHALTHLTKAVTFAHSEKGNRRLSRHELSVLFYLKGYAGIKYFEVCKKSGVRRAAISDLRSCLKNNPENIKAKMALEKFMSSGSEGGSSRLVSTAVPFIVFILSIVVLAAAQLGYFLGVPRSIDVRYYSILTFGACITAIACLFLPGIYKRVEEGIEIKRSAFVRADRAGILTENSVNT